MIKKNLNYVNVIYTTLIIIISLIKSDIIKPYDNLSMLRKVCIWFPPKKQRRYALKSGSKRSQSCGKAHLTTRPFDSYQKRKLYRSHCKLAAFISRTHSHSSSSLSIDTFLMIEHTSQ